MDTFSNWCSVRMWESRVARDLRQRRVLWLHGFCIGLITLVSDGAADAADGIGKLAGSAMEAASGSDEAAIVVVPVVAVFLMGCAVFFGTGSLVLLYFGWEVLALGGGD